MPASPTAAQTPYKGRHHAFIKSTVDDSFKTATVGRGSALAATPLRIAPWYTAAPTRLHDQLQSANLTAWSSQNKVDQLFKDLQDIRSFAAPLLQARLKERYGVENDVEATWLRLYLPKDKPWYVIDLSGGVTTRTVSLLDAALHNFAKDESVDLGSEFISKPDSLGHFDVVPIKAKMSISQFQALCRELDIGAQYKKHLERYLLPGEALAEAVMQLRVTESAKDALRVAAQLALTTGDLQYDAYKLILSLAKDEVPQLQLDGRIMGCHDLSMLETRLTGILLLVPAVTGSRAVRRVIAYVPHDPDHPLKEYESPDAFMTELSRQLRENKIGAASKLSYQQFFSQFVGQQQRGHFFADLDQRLLTVRWHEKGDPTDQSPTWREDPASRPNLQFQLVPVAGNYWTHVYQRKLDKILNDARQIAVSTADTDSKARWDWWDNFKKILSDIFNVALLIATPFVPGLGELMMAYTVYQLTRDVIEGIVDLAEGLGTEAAEHVISVVTDVIQLAAFSAGAKIGEVFKVKLSPLVDRMKPVKLPDGKQTLWHPDIAPYEQKNLSLTPGSTPDQHGLHQHAGQHFLPLENKLYLVEKVSPETTSRTHRIKHPTRPNAYTPTLEHNGHGAWVHEAENPAHWEGATLMRRLGHKVDRFSPSELEQIRISSGTDDNQLRRMHVERNPTPPVLADTVKRFSAHDEALIQIANIRAGRPLSPASLWFESMITTLPGWPSERALQVFESADLTGVSRTYGNAAASDADTLKTSLADVTSGKLPEQVLGFLKESEVTALLGREVPDADRTQAFRDQLADSAAASQREIADYLYQAQERSGNGRVGLLRKTFADMPLSLTESLLTDANATERKVMDEDQRLPLRLKTLAREMNFEADTARAYGGFYQDEQVVPNTERLALNTLKFLSDSFADLRIEVRDGTYDGTLRCSVGPDDAATVRRLVRDEHGRYEVLDADNKTLHEAGDFYESVLRALPDDKRAALGYSRGHGALLRLWIMEKSAPPAERRTVMAEPPIRPVASLETVKLVRGWDWFFGPKTAEQKVRELYPELGDLEVERFVEALRAKGDFDQAITGLKNELNELRTALDAWEGSQEPEVSSDVVGAVSDYHDFLFKGGRWLKERLLQCFERRRVAFEGPGNHPDGGYALNLSSDLQGPELDRWWDEVRELPNIKKYLDQITSLSLDKARFSPGDDGLLGDFPNLRKLQIIRAGLNEVPPSVKDMPALESLNLTDNNIRLEPDAAEPWNGLNQLRTLRLDSNLLGRSPNVADLPRLQVLRLANTGIHEWPTGIFQDSTGNNRPRGFHLDMRDCPIDTLPEVTDPAHVLTVASARFDASGLADADKSRLGDYRESVGLARVQRYSPAAVEELRHWPQQPEASPLFSNAGRYTMDRDEMWQDVMAEPGSTDFFKVIRKQRETHDFRTAESRKRLTERVWQMVEAAALDSELRQQLFLQARQPETCMDAGSQMFNSLGLKVLISKAFRESTSPEVLENNLVRLARSAARLEKIGDVARAEISSQQQQHLIDPRNVFPPDDVVVHLAFETGLAKRLELPWQSDGLVHVTRANVDKAKIDRAYDSIIAREQGDGLIDAMIDSFETPFWEQHLRATRPQAFKENDQLFAEKQEQLEDLRTAQKDWADHQDPTQTKQLKQKLEALAQALNAPQQEVFSGEEMSTRAYNRLLNGLADERKGLARRLTREAMTKAGLL